MKEAAEAFIEQHQMTNEIRFDIISIIIGSKRKIMHIPNDFSAFIISTFYKLNL